MGVILFPPFVSGTFYIAELDKALQCLKRRSAVFLSILSGDREVGVPALDRLQ